MRLNVLIPPKWEAVTAAETSEIRAETDHLVLHLFCDGSFKRPTYKAGIGIVVNFWLPRNTMKQRLSKSCPIHCSFPDNNNTIEAFALAEGAYYALEQISSIKSRFPTSISSTTKIEVVFWSDSQTVLGALADPARALSLSKKMQHILDIIKLKTRELQESSADVSIQFCWCPEECAEPHATADRLSKEARMFGLNKYSRAMALFLRVPHKDIESALNRPQNMQPSVAPTAQLSSLGADSTSTAKATKLSGRGGSSLATTNTGSRRLPHSQALVLDLALGTIAEDPVVMNGLYRAACTSKFFSIVSGTVEYLSPDLRASMREAIQKQQEANKKARWYLSMTSDERGETHERYPNLFGLIETAASRLPADQEAQVLNAIALQKDVIKSLLQDELADQVFEFEGNNKIDVPHKPKDLKELKNLEEREIAKEAAKAIEEVDIEEEQAKVIDDEPMDLDEPIMSLDESQFPGEYATVQDPYETAEQPTNNAEEPNGPEESKNLDAPEVLGHSEVSEVPEELQILEEPEILEQARPNRFRAVWDWVGRRVQHL